MPKFSLEDRYFENLEQAQKDDAAWDAEAARRDAEIEQGIVTPVDVKTVLTRLRARIR